MTRTWNDFRIDRCLPEAEGWKSIEMTIDYRIISIGTLAAHLLWDERSNVRTPHATTTLICAGKAKIIVDPSLPQVALIARMSERTPIKADEITHVFLTSFEPFRRRGVAAFQNAKWWLHEPEHEAARQALSQENIKAEDAQDPEFAAIIEQERFVLSRCEIAPDTLSAGVDIFPLPGVTSGSCGILLALAGQTVLICGDTVASIEHLEQGKVLQSAFDIEQAQASFREAVEIADVLILGRDNIQLNPVVRLRNAPGLTL